MFKVDREKCIACKQCIKDCPVRGISLEEGKAYIHNEGCIKCGHCIAICPVEAVSTDDYDMSEVKFFVSAITLKYSNCCKFIFYLLLINFYKQNHKLNL